MNFYFIINNWKLKSIVLLITSVILILSSSLLKDLSVDFIILMTLGYSSAYLIIWGLPLSLLTFYIHHKYFENKIAWLHSFLEFFIQSSIFLIILTLITNSTIALMLP